MFALHAILTKMKRDLIRRTGSPVVLLYAFAGFAGEVDYANPIVEVFCGKSQSFFQIFLFQVGILLKELGPIRIGCQRKQHSANSEPHTSNTRLPVHLIRVYGNSIKRPVKLMAQIVDLSSAGSERFVACRSWPGKLSKKAVLVNAVAYLPL